MSNNKIKKLEQEIKKNAISTDLSKVFDTLTLWIEEMKKSFCNIFVSKKWGNKITIEMEKFEKDFYS